MEKLSVPGILEAILEANEQGWYLYALSQTGPEELAYHPATPRWRCTLRATFGPPRREIADGRGHDPVSAICDALGSAPELEREVSTVNLRGLDREPGAEPAIDLRKLFLKSAQPFDRRL